MGRGPAAARHDPSRCLVWMKRSDAGVVGIEDGQAGGGEKLAHGDTPSRADRSHDLFF